METTAIIAVIVNLIISVSCTIDGIKNPILKPYCEAQGTVMTILSWAFAIISSLVIYWLILYGTGFWNTLGWVLIVLDTITTIGFSVILRFIRIKLSKEEG
jgi:hypothetical protein